MFYHRPIADGADWAAGVAQRMHMPILLLECWSERDVKALKLAPQAAHGIQRHANGDRDGSLGLTGRPNHILPLGLAQLSKRAGLVPS